MESVIYWADGGVLGKNPSPRGVYWSILRTGDRAPQKFKNLQYRTNNDAEWLALRCALRLATRRDSLRRVEIRSDSRLVVNQFNDVWRSKIARHAVLKHECRRLAAQVREVSVVWVPRREIVRKLGH